MSVQEYLNKMKTFIDNLLDFVNNQDNVEERYQSVLSFITDQKIQENRHEFKSLLHIISNILNNHKHSAIFFCKIENIISSFKSDIRKFFSNTEIFNIFKGNKRIILFLIEEEIIYINESIATKIKESHFFKADQYLFYFYPELKPYLDTSIIKEMPQLPPDFDEKRRIGENDHFICELIRKDEVNEFKAYLNASQYSINSKIEESAYETNTYLLNHATSLIEYASFCGSYDIFTYLKSQNAEFNSSLWYFAIHGANIELIQSIENDKSIPIDGSVLKEAIKCYQNDIANYIIDNYFNPQVENGLAFDYNSIKYYNFEFIKEEYLTESLFNDACKYDHYFLVDYFLKNKKIDVNFAIISIGFSNDVFI